MIIKYYIYTLKKSIILCDTIIGIVSGVSLTCKPVNTSNLCIVTWDVSLLWYVHVYGYMGGCKKCNVQ